MKIPNPFEKQKPKIIGEGLDKKLIRIDNNWLKIEFKVNDLTQNQESQSIEYVLVYNFLRDHQIPTFEGTNKSKPAVEYKNGVLKVVNLSHPNHLIYNHHLDSDFTTLQKTFKSEIQINEILVSVHTQLTNIEKQSTKAGIFLTQDCFMIDFDLSKLIGKVFVGNFDSISIIGVREKDIYNLELLEENKINNNRPNNKYKLKTTLNEFNSESAYTYFNWLKNVLHKGFEKKI